MTMLDGALSADETGLFGDVSDPMQCAECLAEGNLCALHEAMGVDLELDLFELLAEGDPARFDDYTARDELAALDDIGGAWS